MHLLNEEVVPFATVKSGAPWLIEFRQERSNERTAESSFEKIRIPLSLLIPGPGDSPLQSINMGLKV